MLALHTRPVEITSVFFPDYRHEKFRRGENLLPHNQPPNYFLGTNVTRAVTAWFFAMPPSTTNPNGVSRMPWLSRRGSYVSSVIVSHCLLCRLNAKVTVDGSAGCPS